MKKIYLCVILVILIVGYSILSNPYVEVKFSDEAKDLSVIKESLDKVYVLSANEDKKYYYDDGIKIKGNEAGYGDYYLYIPLKSGDLIKIRYIKYNNWYKSDISVKAELKRKQEDSYLKINVLLTEKGRFQKEQTTLNKELLLNGEVHELNLAN